LPFKFNLQRYSLVDKILDQAGSKGTGKWTVQLAADSGVAAPSVSAALEARFVSAKLELRQACAVEYGGVTPDATSGVGGCYGFPAEQEAFAVQVSEALYAAKVIAYAQGFALLESASEEHSWGLKLGELARIWRGGCIIRARLLDTIIAAYAANPEVGLCTLNQVDP
jgi:6-phosphogluconate dehydrogenase